MRWLHLAAVCRELISLADKPQVAGPVTSTVRRNRICVCRPLARDALAAGALEGGEIKLALA
jgi:hypothetical protein